MKTLHRFETLDAFRGLTIMLMILVNTPGSFEHVYPLLEHAPWTGCTLADLVFPFFLFSVGFSGYLSCRKQGGNISVKQLKKIIHRVLFLFILGILFNSFPYNIDWSHVRVFGILQRISLAYGTGIILCLLLKSPGKILFGAITLLIIHNTGLFVYAPDAPYSMTHNLSQAFDLLIPGPANVYQGFGLPFDPEGLYGTISSAASVMLGYLSGYWFSGNNSSPTQLAIIAFYGLAFMIAGLLLSFCIPICKALWTASYVLITNGFAIVIFCYALHLWNKNNNCRKLLQPLQAFGINPIFFFFMSAFVAQSLGQSWIIIDGMPLYDWLYTLLLSILSPTMASFIFACLYLCFCLIFAELLYRRKIIMKI